VAFEQAAIKVQKQKEFEELKGAITRAFSPEAIEGFLKRVRRAGIRIRDFDSLIDRGLLGGKGRRPEPGASAKGLYGALSVTDQAQIKEFYLFQVEETRPELRAKYQKLFQYY
jgi:hypothetical protein